MKADGSISTDVSLSAFFAAAGIPLHARSHLRRCLVFNQCRIKPQCICYLPIILFKRNSGSLMPLVKDQTGALGMRKCFIFEREKGYLRLVKIFQQP
jgi:hypothetical protein